MGSSPSIGSLFFYLLFGEILKRPTRADCKSAVFNFAGSNPALPTPLETFDRRFLKNARVAQLVERQPSKLNVAGSNPVSRSLKRRRSSGVERFLGKEEVGSSNLLVGSTFTPSMLVIATLTLKKATLSTKPS